MLPIRAVMISETMMSELLEQLGITENTSTHVGIVIGDDFPDGKIVVVDSLGTSYIQGEDQEFSKLIGEEVIE